MRWRSNTGVCAIAAVCLRHCLSSIPDRPLVMSPTVRLGADQHHQHHPKTSPKDAPLGDVSGTFRLPSVPASIGVGTLDASERRIGLRVRPEQELPLGTQLRRLREAAGITQEELAFRAGLTPNAVSDLERGKTRRPYPHTVRSLANAIGLSEDERMSLLAALPRRDASVPLSGGTIAPPPRGQKHRRASAGCVGRGAASFLAPDH